MLINIAWVVAKCQAHNLIFLIWWMIHQGASERGSERGTGTESDRRERERDKEDETNGPYDIFKYIEILATCMRAHFKVSPRTLFWKHEPKLLSMGTKLSKHSPVYFCKEC